MHKYTNYTKKRAGEQTEARNTNPLVSLSRQVKKRVLPKLHRLISMFVERPVLEDVTTVDLRAKNVKTCNIFSKLGRILID